MNTTPGIQAARFLKSLAVCGGDVLAATAYAEQRMREWGDYSVVKALREKSAVGGLEVGSVGSSDIMADLLAAVRPLTLAGRMPLRRVPSKVWMLTQNAGTVARWVGEGAARKLSAGSYSREFLRLKRVVALTVASNDHLQVATIDGDVALLADLVAACVEALDLAFIARSNAGDDATPAAVTAGVTPIASLGDTIADLDESLRLSVAALVAAGSNLTAAHWAMSPQLAAAMSLARGSGGAPAYPGIGALGGELCGLPVLTSGVVEVDSDGAFDVALVDASQISLAEEPPELRTSGEVVIEMDTAPTGDSTTPGAASQNRVSMFQTDATALLAGFRANWKLRRPGCVQVISGVLTPVSGS